MMQLIEHFKFTENILFEFLVPPLEKKYNYYYGATEDLNKFDEITVILNVKGTKTIVMVDIIQEIACPLKFFLKKALLNKYPLPSQIPLGSLMRFYNRDNYQNYWRDEDLPYTETIDYGPFSLWSMVSGGMQSWIYNRNDKIYLEIGKSYVVPEPQNDQAFEEYITQYKPLFFEEIPREIAQEWLKKAEKIVREIGED